MTSIVRVLNEQTVNQIAAGEVIENPSSVVKELVENALDAKATEVTVEIRGGGRQLIRVTDNGSGMTRDDALLCLERHATSKISAVEDILDIHTMGFRGEAIPSIASISKFSLLTRFDNEEKGTIITIDGGNITTCSSVDRDPGTTIEVKSLFFNVPVRKKFQKSPTHDSNETHKMLCSLALANPTIKFTFISQEKQLLKATVSEEGSFLKLLGERITQVLGREFFVGLCPIEFTDGDLQLSGYIGLPTFHRHNRTGQHLLINNRAVFSPIISYAVREGYGTTLATNRHPVFILHLTLPGGQVDVNVHPQKKEVRLRYGQQQRDLIISAIENALSQGTIEETTTPVGFNSTPSFSYSDPIFEPVNPPEKWVLKETPMVESQPLFTQTPSLSIPKVVTTLPGYLLIKTDDNALQWVDQKAAHARILFEQLNQEEKKTPFTQQLLIPLTVDLTPTEASAIKYEIETLKKWGLGIQEFGPNSFSIDAIPRIWEEREIEQLLHTVAQGMEQNTKWDQKKLTQVVARTALSSKKRLFNDEAQSLINELFKCKTPHYCPSGKPTWVEISQAVIAKLFQTCEK